MLDHTFEEPEEEREREFVDAAAERAEGLHDFDPLFTTLRIPREQALTRPVLTAKPPATLAPGVERKGKKKPDYIIDEQTGCWVWQWSRTTKGYGSIRSEGVKRQAHSVYYERLVGPIPEGLQLDHLCRNPACVNPDHLEPVTSRENTLRGISPPAVNAAKTHCIRGHPFDEDNTRIAANGGRICRICDRAEKRRGRARKGLSNAGERNPRAKLTRDDVSRIRALHAAGVRQARLAETYGMARASIHRIVNHKSWKAAA